MRSFFISLCLLVGLAIGAPATAQTEADDASRDVIAQQLDAFQRDAWDEAYSYASPMIQQRFRNPDYFGEMVRNGYPMVWRPSEFEFLNSEIEGDYLVQRLRLIDGGGDEYIARYRMVRIDGAWRIAGVSIERVQPSFGV